MLGSSQATREPSTYLVRHDPPATLTAEQAVPDLPRWRRLLAPFSPASLR